MALAGIGTVAEVRPVESDTGVDVGVMEGIAGGGKEERDELRELAVVGREMEPTLVDHQLQ